MNTCPNCGKMAGLHSSILQGCMCQYSMQAPQRQPLTDEQARAIIGNVANIGDGLRIARAIEAAHGITGVKHG